MPEASARKTQVEEISPTDITNTIGTLIGLMLTGLGLLANATFASSRSTFLVYASLEVLAMLMFTVTAVLASLASWRGRLRYLLVARALYPVSWLTFSAAVFAILLVFVFGPSAFQVSIPVVSLNTDSLGLLVAAFGLIAAVVAGVGGSRAAESLLRIRTESLEVAPESKSSASRELSAESNHADALVKRAKQLKEAMEELAASHGVQVAKSEVGTANRLLRRGIIEDHEMRLFRAAWDMRSKAVNGGYLDDDDIRKTVEIMVDLTEKLKAKRGERSPQNRDTPTA